MDDAYDTEPLQLNQSVAEKEIVSTKNNANVAPSVTTSVADKSSFSSPQNRRASMTRHSQPLPQPTLPLLGQFMGSVRDTAPTNATNTSSRDVSGPTGVSARGTVVVGGEGSSIVGSDVSRQGIGFSPRDEAKAAPSDVSLDAKIVEGATAVDISGNPAVGNAYDAPSDELRVTETTTRNSRNAIKESRSSAVRMQAVVGSLPILIVDDSVAILKMTKSVIQNECANIRSTYPLSYSRSLSYPLTHSINTMSSASSRPRMGKKRTNGSPKLLRASRS